MGMANSDNDTKIIAEHQLMEHIKKITPEYNYVTADMNEDMKIIYEHSLMQDFLNRKK